MALRANAPATAKHVSETLGQGDQVEANEGMSYGVNDMRDGVNLSRMQVTRPLVMHTEVTNLPNLSGYLRFGRNLPVVRFTDRFNPLPSLAPAFVERTEPPTRLPAGKIIIAQAWARRRAAQAAQQAGAGQGPGESHPSAGQTAHQPSPPAQGDLFGKNNVAPIGEPVPPEVPEEAEAEAFAQTDHGASDGGADTPAGEVPDEEEVTAAPVPLLGAARGSVRVTLDSHGRSDGPREKAKPA